MGKFFIDFRVGFIAAGGQAMRVTASGPTAKRAPSIRAWPRKPLQPARPEIPPSAAMSSVEGGPSITPAPRMSSATQTPTSAPGSVSGAGAARR